MDEPDVVVSLLNKIYSDILRGLSSNSSICQLSQSKRMQCIIFLTVSFCISTVATFEKRQEMHSAGSIKRTIFKRVFSSCCITLPLLVIADPCAIRTCFVHAANPFGIHLFPFILFIPHCSRYLPTFFQRISINCLGGEDEVRSGRREELKMDNLRKRLTLTKLLWYFRTC